MKKALQKKLFKRFPKLFVQKDLSIQQSCMGWGIDCGDGWYELLWNLCEQIELCSDGTEFTQVKEKWGTIRAYCVTDNDHVFDLIDMAEDLSGFICEECGEKGRARGGSWTFTLCNKCNKKRNDN